VSRTSAVDGLSFNWSFDRESLIHRTLAPGKAQIPDLGGQWEGEQDRQPMGLHARLDTALQIALRQMIAVIRERVGITKTEAFQLCSPVADFAATQSVNREKGVHVRPRKALLQTGCGDAIPHRCTDMPTLRGRHAALHLWEEDNLR